MCYRGLLGSKLIKILYYSFWIWGSAFLAVSAFKNHITIHCDLFSHFEIKFESPGNIDMFPYIFMVPGLLLVVQGSLHV